MLKVIILVRTKINMQLCFKKFSIAKQIKINKNINSMAKVICSVKLKQFRIAK